jgi:hypothetical protein
MGISSSKSESARRRYRGFIIPRLGIFTEEVRFTCGAGGADIIRSQTEEWSVVH